MFTIIDSTNSATLTMNNPYTGHSKTVVVLANNWDIAYAIVCYAKSQGLLAEEIETSIIYPEEHIK